MKSINLKEGEMTILINESINGKSVNYGFGPSGVWIYDTIENHWATIENHWAIERIEEMRNNTSEGGGI